MNNQQKQSILFFLWRKLRGLLALLIVVLGLIIGVISLILPHPSLYKDQLVTFLQSQWNKDVRIETVNGEWRGLGPHFNITGLTDTEDVNIRSATLDINIYQLLIPGGKTGLNLSIDSAKVEIIKQPGGEVALTEKSESLKNSLSDQLDQILKAGTFSVKNLSLSFYDILSDTKNELNTQISVQQDQENRAFELTVQSDELAKEFKLMALSDRKVDVMSQAQWYLSTTELSLAKLSELLNRLQLPQSMVDAEAWFSTKNGNIFELSAIASLNKDSSDNDSKLSAQAELVYSGDTSHWNAKLTLKDIQAGDFNQQQIEIQFQRNGKYIFLEADKINISLLKTLFEVLKIESELLTPLELKGELSQLQLTYNYDLRQMESGSVSFDSLNLNSDQGFFNNLAGKLSLNNNTIQLQVDSEDGSGQYPKVTRDVIHWKQLTLNAEYPINEESIDIQIPTLFCDCIDLKLQASGRIRKEERLHLDFGSELWDININQLYKFWPSNVWKPKVLRFLDQALVAGQVKKGWVFYSGFTKDYPFTGKQGIFHARALMDKTTINYQKQWPYLQEFDATVDFINRSMNLKSSMAKVNDAEITDLDAHIESFKAPILEIKSSAKGKNNFLIDILRNSPLASKLSVLNESIEIKGNQKIQVNFEIPLKQPNPEFKPYGRIHFYNNDFQLGQFQLNQLNGPMTFNGFALEFDQLKASFFQSPVTMSGLIRPQPGKHTEIDLSLKGLYQVENFESILGFTLPAKGQSDWQFHITNNNSDQLMFLAESNLNGVQIDMPAPLIKTQDSSAPLLLKCTLPCLDGMWDIDFDHAISANLSMNQASKKLNLSQLIFGDASKVSEDFGGQIDTLDLDSWLELLPGSSSSKSELPFQSMSLNINKLKFMNRFLNQVSVEIEISDSDIHLNISGPEVEGTVTLPKDMSDRGIVMQLKRLHWKQSAEQQNQVEAQNSTANYPPMHIWIEDFIYDGIPLGETRIEARVVTDGLRIDQFTTKSDKLQLNVDGTYFKQLGDKGVSKFNIILASKDLAGFLKELGFNAPLSETGTVIDMQVEWPDKPSAFEIKTMSGNMRIEIGKGEVLDAKPGVGRILGLFSLTNLPRRLLLDFKDVFSQGLHFNSMQGDFELIEGEAYTENFEIDSPAAKIFITGKTGLANRDYQQIITVQPRVGRVLPTIGAVTGGAVGAAAGFLVQNLFRKGLKNVGKIIYKVSGSWDNPQIELVEAIEGNSDS